jgi:hypothetical protein
MVHAAGANSEHGLPRTRKDVRRAVTALLRDEQIGAKSDRTIAFLARTTNKTVGAVRKELGLDGDTRVYTDKHGNEVEMDVTGLKHRPKTIFHGGPPSTFADLPEPARDAIKALFAACRGLEPAGYALVRTWLEKLPARPRGVGDLLAQLELEEEAGKAPPDDGAPDDRDNPKF